MATYKRFEEIPVWQSAIELAAQVFDLTARPTFKFRGDLVNQIRRAALSVSNNIAEGFERGTTADLVKFLYIARGSCGETRSMTRFAVRLGGMESERDGIEAVNALCESVSRQLFGWIDALQNSEIKGVRHLTDQARRDYALSAARKAFSERFGHQAAEAAMREGRFNDYAREKIEALMELKDMELSAGQTASSLSCPVCGGKMVKRHDRNGRPFWGCASYPRCRGSRTWDPSQKVGPEAKRDGTRDMRENVRD